MLQIQMVRSGVIQPDLIDIPHAQTLRFIAAQYNVADWDQLVYVPGCNTTLSLAALYNAITEHVAATLK